LKPNSSGPSQRREKQAFASEQRALDFADILNVVLNGRLKGNNAASVHSQDLTGGQVALVDRAAGMNEGQSVALQPFQDKAFTAKKTGAKAFGEGDPDAHPFGSA